MALNPVEQFLYRPRILFDEMKVIDGKVDVRDHMLAKEIGLILLQHYPGHGWRVSACGKTGIVTIMLYGVSVRNGVTLLMSSMNQHDEMRRKVIDAGGQILERSHIRRGNHERGEYDHLKMWRYDDRSGIIDPKQAAKDDFRNAFLHG